MGIHAKTIGSQAPNIQGIHDKPIFYDVFSCDDGTKIKNGITAKSAADFAGVSENFVIMTSIKPAKNKYGHLATMSGYYFARHNSEEDPVTFDLPRDPGNKPGTPRIYKINPEILSWFIKYRGYETAQQFCERNELKYDTLIAHVTQGINTRPATSQFATKLCRLLGAHMMKIYYMRFVR